VQLLVERCSRATLLQQLLDSGETPNLDVLWFVVLDASEAMVLAHLSETTKNSACLGFIVVGDYACEEDLVRHFHNDSVW